MAARIDLGEIAVDVVFKDIKNVHARRRRSWSTPCHFAVFTAATNKRQHLGTGGVGKRNHRSRYAHDGPTTIAPAKK
jgi:hypothetical protein